MNYLTAFSLNDVVAYRGKRLIIKSLYDKGAVCRTLLDNELYVIEGLENITEVVHVV